MNREDWRLVGLALLEGRKLHPANVAFGKWCLENGFTMDASVRSNAVWLAENWDEVQTVLHGVQDAHPSHIRSAYRKAKRAAEAGAPAVPAFTNDDALYALKLAAVAERGGSETERQLRRVDMGVKGSAPIRPSRTGTENKLCVNSSTVVHHSFHHIEPKGFQSVQAASVTTCASLQHTIVHHCFHPVRHCFHHSKSSPPIFGVKQENNGTWSTWKAWRSWSTWRFVL